MNIWCEVFIISMIVPSLIFIAGRSWMVKPPKNINPIYGYRTMMSMKNENTWTFAHKYIGRIWAVAGKIMLFVSLAVMILVSKRSEDTITNAAIVLLLIQTAVIVLSIIPTEIALRKKFDKYGILRQE